MSLVAYTTHEAVGALRNGTRIEKTNSRAGEDTHPDGALGVVIGSLGPLPDGAPEGARYGYFVIWDDAPQVPVFVGGTRVREVRTDA